MTVDDELVPAHEVCNLCENAAAGRCDQCGRPFCGDHSVGETTMLLAWRRCRACSEVRPQTGPMISDDDKLLAETLNLAPPSKGRFLSQLLIGIGIALLGYILKRIAGGDLNF